MSATAVYNEDELQVIAVFTADPDCLRMLDANSVTEEVLFGEHAGLVDDEEDLPDDETYERYQAALDRLVNEGTLETNKALGCTVYHLSNLGAAEHLGMAVTA